MAAANALIALSVFAGKSVAQNSDSLRANFLIAVPSNIEIARTLYRRSPGSSAATPVAYGAEWGDVFVGAGFQNRMRYVSSSLPVRQRADGAVVTGFGLGNPRQLVGLELAYTSFSTVRSGFFNHSSVSFKIHRELPANFAIAYGWEDWIRSKGLDGGSSMYGVLSSFIRTRESDGSPFSSVTLSAGVGGGRFQTEQAIDQWKHGANAFGSIGVRVASPMSLIADWTGQDLTVGASIVPFARLPLYISPGFADVTHTAGDGARFILGVGLDLNFNGK
jgi:hypothetical protein